MDGIREEVRAYYEGLGSNEELKTGACSCDDRQPKMIKDIIARIPDEIKERFYGCGSPIPAAVEGCTVLDLGCGTGRDVYVVSALVGEGGRVIGVDQSEKQLRIACRHQDHLAREFGFSKSNVEFKKGYIEDLRSLDIADDSIDVVISNCVINLSPFKEQVFREIRRVLKKGGELYFSDVFADRRVPPAIADNPILRGECLGGALYIEDFRRLMRKCGWEDFRYVKSTRSAINNEEIERLIGEIEFSSRTIRAIKHPFIEDICEQYGQEATYNGEIPGMNQFFDLDDHHRFFSDEPMKVCGNSCCMVENTRFGRYFTITGDRSHHYGSFAGCGNAPAPSEDDRGCDTGCCC